MAAFGHAAVDHRPTTSIDRRRRPLRRPRLHRSSPTPARRATRWPPRPCVAGGSRCPGSTANSRAGRRRLRDVLRPMGCVGRRVATSRPSSRRGAACGGSTSTWSTCPTSCRRSPPWPRSPTRRHGSAASASSAPRRATGSATCAPSCGGCGADADETDDGLAIEPADAARRAARHPPRPSAGDGVRRDRPARRRRRDRRSRRRVQELAGILGRARRACE